MNAKNNSKSKADEKARELVIDPQTLYNVFQLEAMFDLTEKTLVKSLQSGELKGNKLGNKWWVTGSSLLEYFSGSKDTKG